MCSRCAGAGGWALAEGVFGVEESTPPTASGGGETRHPRMGAAR